MKPKCYSGIAIGLKVIASEFQAMCQFLCEDCPIFAGLVINFQG